MLFMNLHGAISLTFTSLAQDATKPAAQEKAKTVEVKKAEVKSEEPKAEAKKDDAKPAKKHHHKKVKMAEKK